MLVVLRGFNAYRKQEQRIHGDRGKSVRVKKGGMDGRCGEVTRKSSEQLSWGYFAWVAHVCGIFRKRLGQRHFASRGKREAGEVGTKSEITLYVSLLAIVALREIVLRESDTRTFEDPRRPESYEFRDARISNPRVFEDSCRRESP